MLRKLLTLFVALFAINCQAQINLYVDNNVAASGGGTTWATAYKTLNEALNVANAASTTVKYSIYIAAGMYYPTGIQSATNRDTAFSIVRGGIKLYGGYPSGGGTRNPAVFLTILSGYINSNVTTDNSYHILVASNIAATGDSIVIDGFNFRGGFADGTGTKTYNGQAISRASGGAMYFEDILCVTIIRNCITQDNMANSSGATIYQNTSAGVIIDSCTFQSGYGGRGSGIYLNSASCKIRNSTFTNNSGLEGAALYQNGNHATGGSQVSGCTFTTNNTTTSSTGGGAIFRNGGLVISNSSFIGNSGYRGGAIYSLYSGNITSCSFKNNAASLQGGAIYTDEDLNVDSSIFTGNKANSAGGGIYFTVNAGYFISNSYFFRDSAASGGAIYTGGNQAFYVYGCRFINNVADNGGALYKTTYGGIWQRNVLSGNRAAVNGGAIYASGSGTFKISSSLISGNKAGNFGGAVYATSTNSGMDFTNCTFSGDTAVSGNAFYNVSSSPVITNCIIWDGASSIFNITNSTPAITYSVVAGGYTGSNNNGSNPMFLNAVSAATAPDTTGNYRLAACSPAVNSGTNTVTANIAAIDLDNSVRVYNTTIDRGAYEQGPLATSPILGGTLVCQEATLQLSHAIPGGVWTSSTPGIATVNSTGLVTALNPGTDTIIYTISASPYCGAVARLVITVNPVLNNNGITLNRTSICQNGTLTATTSTTGGTWSLTNTALANISLTGVVTGISYGIDSVVYSVTHPNGCINRRYAAFQLQRKPTAPPITGSTFTVCKNKQIVVQCAKPMIQWVSTGGINWNPISSNPTSSVYVVGNQPGTFILYAITDSLGCKDSATAMITVLPTAPIGVILGPNDTMCLRSSMTFSNTVSGGTWSSSNPAVASINTTNGTVTSYVVGQTTIKYTTTNSNGCDTSTGGVLYVVTPGANIQSFGGFLRGKPDNAANYMWIKCNAGNVMVGTAQDFTPTSNGTYAVVVDKFGCSDTSACYSITDLAVFGMGSGSGLTVYPNPAWDKLFIQQPTNGLYTVRVSDITGKVVTALTSSLKTTIIDVSGYNAGMYVVEVSEVGGGKAVRRISIIR